VSELWQASRTESTSSVSGTLSVTVICEPDPLGGARLLDASAILDTTAESIAGPVRARGGR